MNDRHSKIQSYRVYEIVIGIKAGNMQSAQPDQISKLQGEIEELKRQAEQKVVQINKLNDRLREEINTYYEQQFIETIKEVATGYATKKEETLKEYIVNF